MVRRFDEKDNTFCHHVRSEFGKNSCPVADTDKAVVLASPMSGGGHIDNVASEETNSGGDVTATLRTATVCGGCCNVVDEDNDSCRICWSKVFKYKRRSINSLGGGFTCAALLTAIAAISRNVLLRWNHDRGKIFMVGVRSMSFIFWGSLSLPLLRSKGNDQIDRNFVFGRMANPRGKVTPSQPVVANALRHLFIDDANIEYEFVV